MKKTLVGTGIAVAALAFVLAGPEPAQATMEFQKAAKAAGLAVANCKHCHNAAMPKKGTPDLNETGKWLVDQKAAKKADKIDVTWLKDYKPAK
ncbi:MAG: hypothetical protein NDJ94_02795 [Vicinamibacteria bacterium]|nr:hypothetical protein [Vicinamibacteria bacterium]